ncbi:MAG: heparan N-sulfatase [Gammaproteobacteria bacterium]|nr:MAG: heparan N-sulfatase [Gammaproteobacteria bacterium]
MTTRVRWAGIFALWFCSMSCIATPSGKPNFIVFVLDDLGWEDLGAYGNPYVKTPVIDQLASQGMVFEKAFLTTSSCTASRASMLTGLYPHNTGDASNLGGALDPAQIILPGVLHDHGYFSAALGKWHVGRATLQQIDAWGDDTDRGTSAWVDTLRNRPKEKPFFLWLATYDPHAPYDEIGEDSIHSTDKVLIPPYLPDTMNVRKHLVRYYNEIARADSDIATVLEEVLRQGIENDTWIFVLSDNGAPFPRAKLTLYDSGIKTPLIVVGPGIHVGRQQALVSSIDILPTILDLAAVTAPAFIEGKSFRQILETGSGKIRDNIVAEQNEHGVPLKKRAIRDDQYLYIRNLQQEGRHCSFETGLRKHFTALFRASQLTPQQSRCLKAEWPREEFYDLAEDPYTLDNKVNAPALQAELFRMRQELMDWAKQSGDEDLLEAMQK